MTVTNQGHRTVGTLGATGQTSSIWGPFAGYGTRREHVSWLLEGLGDRAEQLRDTITQRFESRQIPDAQVRPLLLTGKGVAIEERPFYRIRRGLATVWLYVARFGEDLYVSQVSYVKGPISVARVIVASALAILVASSMLCSFVNMLQMDKAMDLFIPTSPFDSSGGSDAGSGLAGLLLMSNCCCFSPLGTIAFFPVLLGVVYSIYKFIAEKDILALFRASPNEFQIDDISSLEKAVNETVRQSADMIGIDRRLLSPAQGRQMGRRLV